MTCLRLSTHTPSGLLALPGCLHTAISAAAAAATAESAAAAATAKSAAAAEADAHDGRRWDVYGDFDIHRRAFVLPRARFLPPRPGDIPSPGSLLMHDLLG